MRAVPGPIRRLLRNRVRLVAVGLLAATAVAASGLQTVSAVVLQGTLDEHWRGAYDLLVTQRGKDPTTAGLLRSDATVDALTGRLGWDDLERIRALPGVAVAAPVALVAVAETGTAGDPRLWLPVPVRADASLEHPQAFRVTVSATMDDGVAPRELAGHRVIAFAYQPSYSQLVFDESGAPLRDAQGREVYATIELADTPRLLSADTSVPFTAGDFDAATGTIPLGLVIDPRPAANVVLVDPVAERALLGEAGAFLDPLIAADRDATVERIPVIVSQRAPTPITVTVTVEEFDGITPGAAGADAVERAQGTGFLQNGQIAPSLPPGAPTTVIDRFEVDVAPAIAPFAPGLVVLGDLDAERADATRARLATTTSPRSVQEGRYLVPDDAREGGAVALAARGYVSFGQYVEAPVSGTAPRGAVTEYRKLFGAVGSVRPGELTLPPFEAVGSYRVEQLRADLGEASFAPLGGYDMPNPQLAGSPLATSISGFGIPGANDLAIGSFSMLEGWDAERPISAIRIRVAGEHDYSPAAQQQLLQAVTALTSLGYQATIVAGSSPQDMPVLVSGFALAETDPGGGQLIGELGEVTQRWSRLGAVVEAERAVSATSIAFLASTIVAVGTLLAVVQFGSLPGRRANAAILRRAGWRRGAIARWYLAEEAVALLGLAIVGTASIAFATVPAVAAGAVAAALALVVTTSLIVVAAGARVPGRSVRRIRSQPATARVRVHGPLRFGARQALGQLTASLSLTIALALMALFAGIGATALVQGRELAGPSALGELAFARSGLPHLLLVGIGLTSAILLVVLSRRVALRRRRAQWHALRAMGWTRADVTRAHLAELATGAIPGAVLGVVAITLATAIAGGPVLAVALASGLTVLAALVVVVASGRTIS